MGVLDRFANVVFSAKTLQVLKLTSGLLRVTAVQLRFQCVHYDNCC